MEQEGEEEEATMSARRLLKAACRGDVHECAALIGDGVSPSAYVHGTTPLHEATRRGQHPVTLLLLERRANTQIRNCDGLTPFNLHERRYNWFGTRLVHPTRASHNAWYALRTRTYEEYAAAAAAVEAARVSWRAANPQRVAELDAAREALEAQMERDEITEGHFVERMNALRDEYVRCSS